MGGQALKEMGFARTTAAGNADGQWFIHDLKKQGFSILRNPPTF
jgi:hypothetical protein